MPQCCLILINLKRGARSIAKKIGDILFRGNLIENGMSEFLFFPFSIIFYTYLAIKLISQWGGY